MLVRGTNICGARGDSESQAQTRPSPGQPSPSHPAPWTRGRSQDEQGWLAQPSPSQWGHPCLGMAWSVAPGWPVRPASLVWPAQLRGASQCGRGWRAAPSRWAGVLGLRAGPGTGLDKPTSPAQSCQQCPACGQPTRPGRHVQHFPREFFSSYGFSLYSSFFRPTDFSVFFLFFARRFFR